MSNSKWATQAPAGFSKGKACSEWVEMFVKIPIGGTGAVGTLVKDSEIDVVRDSAGQYTLTYPKGQDCVPVIATVSAAATIITCAPTAMDATAGTLTVVCRNAAGAATDPASGDILRIVLKVRVHL
jgi:hypothetical protein